MLLLEEIARILTSYIGVTTLSLSIILTALFIYAFGFYRRTRPIVRNLENANQRLQRLDGQSAFARGFEEFNSWVRTNELLGDIWREFYETLIFPGPVEQGQVIRNSQDPSLFFNEQSLIHSRLNTSFYNVFPNYLTGAGILGTFIGLVCGLLLAHKGFASENVKDVTQALGQLLGGASLAFITSIVGLLSSIIFSWREKNRTHHLQNLVANWNSLLNERLSLITTEKLAASSLMEFRKQTLQLERFNTELAVSIATALDERLAGRLGSGLDKLVTTVERLREDRGEVNQQLLDTTVEEFKKSLSRTAGSEMNSVVETLQELNQTLGEATGAIATGQQQMHEVTQKIATNVENAIHQGSQSMHEEIARAIEKLGGALKNASDDTAEKLKEAGSQTCDSITRSTEGFEQSVNRLVVITNNTQELMQQTQGALNEMDGLSKSLRETHGSYKAISEALHETASSIRDAGLRTRETMENTSLLVKGLKEVAAQMEETSEDLTNSWVEYGERFEGVDNSLKGIFQEINEGIGRYTERVKDFVVELDKHMAQAIGDLGGAIGELNEAVEELSDTSVRMSA